MFVLHVLHEASPWSASERCSVWAKPSIVNVVVPFSRFQNVKAIVGFVLMFALHVECSALKACVRAFPTNNLTKICLRHTFDLLCPTFILGW